MRSVSTTFTPKHRLLFFLLVGSLAAGAQENSPYSRYGLGDIFPGQHILSRGMGGISAAYRDQLGQSVNFYNPATYSGINLVSYDIGIGIDSRSLRSANPVAKYNSVNFTPSYVALGMPLSKAHGLGIAFGLRPISKINYSVVETRREANIDSISTLYDGSGGLYQIFAGIGKRWGGFSIGVNGGYTFGRKETNTKVIFLNDTLPYSASNYGTVNSYNKFIFSGGLQYQFKTSKRSLIRLGLEGQAQQSMKASQDVVKQTFYYDGNGNIVGVDTALSQIDKKGTITLPATYTAGIAFEILSKEQFNQQFSRMLVSAEYESTKWSNYRFFGQPDKVVDNWQMRLGLQISPDLLKASSFWSRLTYRTGFFYGKDYINADGNELKSYGITLGAGIPILRRTNLTNQYSNIHTAFEFGKRGSSVNNITENFFRVSVGLSLSDIWFIKRKYD